MDINTQLQYRYAQQQRSNRLAAMSDDDRNAWLAQADRTLRIGDLAKVGHALLHNNAQYTEEVHMQRTMLGMAILATTTAMFKDS
jgi:hypothetical protein